MQVGVDIIQNFISRAFSADGLRIGGTEAAEETASGTDQLCLIITDQNWFSRISATSQDAESVTSSGPGDAAEASLDQLAIIQDALAAMSPSQQRAIRCVHLIIADPTIEAFDNRLTRLRHDDPQKVREFAAQQLGAEESAFALVPFGESSNEEQTREIVFSTGIDTLRRYLIEMGQLSLRITEVVPRLSLLIQRLSRSQDTTSCAIDIGGHTTTILFANRVSGAVFQQTVRVGTQTLRQILSDEMGVSPEEAQEALTNRSLLPDPQAFLEQDFSNPTLSTGTAQALRAPLLKIYHALQEGLEFFAFQRLHGKPTLAVATPEIDQIRGLANWISAILGVGGISVLSNDDLITELATGQSANLLAGAPKSLLTIGDQTYRFEKGQLTANQSTATPKKAKTTDPFSSAPDLMSLLGSRTSGFDAESIKQVGAFAALLASIVFGLWQLSYAPAQGSMRSALNIYQQAENQAKKITADRETPVSPQANEFQPASSSTVVWAPKIVSIAQHSIDGMWITSISGGAQDSRTDRAIEISGFVRNQDEQALAAINQFVRRLKSDETFMDGLSDVKVIRTSNSEGSPDLNFLIVARR